jgi:hypothetical protein
MEDASIFIAELLLLFSAIPELYPLSGFDCGALVIARLQLATGIRPVGRKAHNAGSKRRVRDRDGQWHGAGWRLSGPEPAGRRHPMIGP